MCIRDSFVAAVGLFILPARRAKAKAELTNKISKLRSQLMATITEQFDHESERSLLRIREAVGPYTRFVRAEREQLNEMSAQIEAARRSLEGLRTRVEQIES